MSALSELMDFGMVVWSKGDGRTVRQDMRTFGRRYVTPEEVQYVDLDADGGASDPVAPAGWQYLTGFTGQYSYHGNTMHPSEYIGGALEQYILSTPGYYVAVAVDAWVDDTNPDVPSDEVDTENVGWAVLQYVGR